MKKLYKILIIASTIAALAILVTVLIVAGVFESEDKKCRSDIPNEIINDFYSAYDKPGLTSWLYFDDYGLVSIQNTQYNVEVQGSVAQVEIIQEFENPEFDKEFNTQYIFAM